MASIFSYETNIQASSADVFTYYNRGAVLQRLTPPWEAVSIVGKTGGIHNQGTTELQIKVGPMKVGWKARHQDYILNAQFCDTQVSGPFKYWKHTHSFRSIAENEMTLNDTIHYQLQFGSLGHLIGAAKIKQKLNRLFAYRHAVTQNDLRHFLEYKDAARSRIAITGGNGLIGSALAVFLESQGHEVVILSRSGKSKVFGIKGVRWNPYEHFIDTEAMGAIDSWIHLAGENLAGGRWTKKRMKQLRESRVEVTRFLTDFILKQDTLPRSFICASGTGFYGSTASDTPETTARGTGFLADLCEAWENASTPLEDAGIRRVVLRTGIVFSGNGGALAKLLPIFKSGLGGRVGKGDQFWSWIAIDDLLRIYDSAISNESINGSVNAVSPAPMSNNEFSKILAKVLGRPAFFPVPAFILKLAIGRMAEEALLSGQKVIPVRLNELSFHFDYPDLELALSHCLGKY